MVGQQVFLVQRVYASWKGLQCSQARGFISSLMDQPVSQREKCLDKKLKLSFLFIIFLIFTHKIGDRNIYSYDSVLLFLTQVKSRQLYFYSLHTSQEQAIVFLLSQTYTVFMGRNPSTYDRTGVVCVCYVCSMCESSWGSLEGYRLLEVLPMVTLQYHIVMMWSLHMVWVAFGHVDSREQHRLLAYPAAVQQQSPWPHTY